VIEYRAVDGAFIEQGRYRPGTTATLEIAPDASVSFDPAIFLN